MDAYKNITCDTNHRAWWGHPFTPVSHPAPLCASLEQGCPLSPQAMSTTATRASNSRAKGGAASSGACGPVGRLSARTKDAMALQMPSV